MHVRLVLFVGVFQWLGLSIGDILVLVSMVSGVCVGMRYMCMCIGGMLVLCVGVWSVVRSLSLFRNR